MSSKANTPTEAMAKIIYAAYGYAYEGRTLDGTGKPYGEWAKAVAAAAALQEHAAPVAQVAGTPPPHPDLRGIPEGFNRQEIEDMLSIVQDEEQTVDGGGEFGPQESTDGWYTRLLRTILKNAEGA